MGNLIDDPECKLRKYLRDGSIEGSGEWTFKYDKDGQLIEKFRGKTGFYSKKKDRWSQKRVIKNRCIMLKYFYNKEIGFLEVDPEFVELGLKYAQRKALEY